MSQHVYLHAVTHLARGASAFDFRPVDGTPLIPFTAGAHADLILPNGVRRSYSLCNSQDETHRYVVGVKKASPSRGASVYLHDQLRIGAEIDIADRTVTSLENEINPAAHGVPSLEDAGNTVARHFGAVFGHQVLWRESLADLIGDGAKSGDEDAPRIIPEDTPLRIPKELKRLRGQEESVLA